MPLLPAAEADTTDLVSSFDAMATAGISYCGVGTGLAFDGENLLVSCWGSNVLERVDPVAQTNSGPVTVTGLYDIEAMAYDGGRDRLWVCSSHSQVTLVDHNAGVVDTSVVPFSVPACTDGLAYDGEDDTIWVSPDSSSTVYHYDLSGTQLGSFYVGSLLAGCGNSGIAVGGEKLYLANNGCSTIFEVPKDFSSSTQLASYPARLEDLECDGVSFPGKSVIWSQDAYDRVLNAWEIPSGLCELGGGFLNSAASESFVASVQVAPASLDTAKIGRSSAGIGETKDASILGHDQLGVAAVGGGRTTASATADGATTRSLATASVAHVDLLNGLVRADKVVSSAAAAFDGDTGLGSTNSTGAALVGLMVNGLPVSDGVPANTTVGIPGGKVVLREEVTTSDESGVSMQVNAIHVTTDDGAIDVIVSSAFAAAGGGAAVPEDRPVLTPLPAPPEPPATPSPSSLPTGAAAGLAGPYLQEGFEGTAPGWTITNADGRSPDGWEIGAPSGGPGSAHGGSGVAATGLKGSYGSNARSELRSPAIDLTRVTPSDLQALGKKVVLRYSQWFKAMPYGWDCGVLTLRANGRPAETLEPEGGYPAAYPYCDGTYPAGAFAYDQSAGGWQEVVADLSSYVGSTVTLQWDFRSYSYSFYYGSWPGWYVDDVSVALEPVA